MTERDLPEFNKMFLATVDETLTGLLGGGVLSSIYDHLLKFHGIRRDEIPYRLETFMDVLRKTFGFGAVTIERSISKGLYRKLDLSFIDLPEHKLTDYVADAKRRLETMGPSA